ncbi:MAG: flagellar export chaperone FliS [Verrucomicrobiales bacterium]|nr:flagellar export chaperone FliS [Verrucomicrobiales bacterium]
MSYARPWTSYRQTSTQTASPGQLVLMLYDGALRFLAQALEGFRHEDPLAFHQTISNNVLRAQSILGELNSTLDMDRGGALARTLRALYDYLDDRLTESNFRKRADGIQDAMRRLTVLRDAWAEMLRGQAERADAAEAPGSLCVCG